MKQISRFLTIALTLSLLTSGCSSDEEKVRDKNQEAVRSLKNYITDRSNHNIDRLDKKRKEVVEKLEKLRSVYQESQDNIRKDLSNPIQSLDSSKKVLDHRIREVEIYRDSALAGIKKNWDPYFVRMEDILKHLERQNDADTTGF